MPAGFYPRKSVEARFWPFVNKNGTVYADLGRCWVWMNTSKRVDRQRMSYKGKPTYVYRISWIIHHGAIQDGLCVLHKCDNILCVNPAHLFLGTQLDNIKDMVHKQRNPKGEQTNKHKISTEDVILMRKLSSEGWSTTKLMIKFGLSRAQTNAIIRRAFWKHV